jgi:hypothetical protein
MSEPVNVSPDATRSSSWSFRPALEPTRSALSVENSSVPFTDQIRTRTTRGSLRTSRWRARVSEDSSAPVIGVDGESTLGSTARSTYATARACAATRSRATTASPWIIE